MLILTRKKNQSLRIGDDIILTVVDVQGDQVRLGIVAPKEVTILRQELYDDVKNSNKEAAQAFQNMDVTFILNQVKQLEKNTKEE